MLEKYKGNTIYLLQGDFSKFAKPCAPRPFLNIEDDMFHAGDLAVALRLRPLILENHNMLLAAMFSCLG